MGRNGQLPLLVSLPDGTSGKACAASAQASSWVKSLCGPRSRADGGCAGTWTCSRLTRNCIRYRQRLAPAGGSGVSGSGRAGGGRHCRGGCRGPVQGARAGVGRGRGGVRPDPASTRAEVQPGAPVASRVRKPPPCRLRHFTLETDVHLRFCMFRQGCHVGECRKRQSLRQLGSGLSGVSKLLPIGS